MASSELIALDARMILYKPNFKEDRLPKLAIRPYPTQYIGKWTIKSAKVLFARDLLTLL